MSDFIFRFLFVFGIPFTHRARVSSQEHFFLSFLLWSRFEFVCVPNAVGCSAQSTTYNYIGHMYFASRVMQICIVRSVQVSKLLLQSINMRVHYYNRMYIIEFTLLSILFCTSYWIQKFYVTFEPHKINALMNKSSNGRKKSRRNVGFVCILVHFLVDDNELWPIRVCLGSSSKWTICRINIFDYCFITIR